MTSNKYIAVVSEKEKVLKGPVEMAYPTEDDIFYNDSYVKKFEEYIASLPSIPAEWLKESDNGRLLTLDFDFSVKQLQSELIREDYPYKKAKYFCNECCNKDRCDDSSHYYRKECPYCLGKGQRDFDAIALPIDKQISMEKMADFHESKFYESDKQEGKPERMPKIVCLCGSTRFMEAFQTANLKFTCEGKIVLSVGCNTKSDRDLLFSGELTHELKIMLDELHKRKIDLCDEVFVLNVGGYIGESTRSEIDYAIKIGKPIKYLEP